MNYCVSCGKNYDQEAELCPECLAQNGAEKTSNSVGSSEAISGTHPWRRLFARTIDYTVLYLIIGLIIGVFIPSGSASFVFTGNEFLDVRLINILILALACIIEPIILTSFG
ncbi:MAG TPA: RDD family protein, partial [Methylovorus sp.]|nr:RDD family protein [Methylovorus sp.]